MLAAFEGILLFIGIVLSYLWVMDSGKNYEPIIVLLFSLLMIVEIYRRRQDSRESMRKLDQLAETSENEQEEIFQKQPNFRVMEVISPTLDIKLKGVSYYTAAIDIKNIGMVASEIDVRIKGEVVGWGCTGGRIWDMGRTGRIDFQFFRSTKDDDEPHIITIFIHYLDLEGIMFKQGIQFSIYWEDELPCLSDPRYSGYEIGYEM